jgi:hypothetical protein
MHWKAELAYFIRPKWGPVRPMFTLLDANHAVLDDLSAMRRRRAHWIRAKRLLLAAAESGAEGDILAATEALANALILEGWMMPRSATPDRARPIGSGPA